MLFAAICTDRSGTFEARLSIRPNHLDWMATVADQVRIAGPFLDESGETMTGSMLIVEGDSISQVRALLAEDPYAKAGLFAEVEVRPWRWTIDNTGVPK